MFYEVATDQLPLYIDLGLTLLKLGEEARVPLANFSLDGPNRRALRRTQRQMERDGVTFEVVSAGSGARRSFPSSASMSDAWLEEKRTGEKGFSLGRFDDAYLSPLSNRDRSPWRSHRRLRQCLEYAAQVGALGRPDALHAGRPGGVMQFLFHGAHDLGKGAAATSTSGSAWRPSPASERRMLAPLWSRLGAFMYRHGEHFYNFQGLREYKEKFDPVWEPRYLASPGGLALPRILTNVATLISGGVRGVVSK